MQESAVRRAVCNLVSQSNPVLCTSLPGGAGSGDSARLISMTYGVLGGRGILFLVASVFVACGGSEKGDRDGQGAAAVDFRTTPPRAESVEIQRMPGAGDSTRMTVTFANDPRLPDRLPVRLDSQEVVLTRQEIGRAHV